MFTCYNKLLLNNNAHGLSNMYSTSHFKSIIEKPITNGGIPNPSGDRVALDIMNANWKENKYDRNTVNYSATRHK